MKKENVFVRALKTKEGKSSFVIAVIFTALLYPIGAYAGGSHFGFIAMIICSMLSLSASKQFAQVLIYIRDNQE